MLQLYSWETNHEEMKRRTKKVNPKRVGNVIEQLNTLNKGKSRYDFGEEDRILDYYMKRYY